MRSARHLVLGLLVAAAVPANAVEFRSGFLAGGTLDEHGEIAGYSGALAIAVPLGSVLSLELQPGYYRKGAYETLSYVGMPVLLRWPRRKGVYTLAGGELNVLVSAARGAARLDTALSAGMGVDFGSGRARWLLEARYSQSFGTEEGSWLAAPGPPGVRVKAGGRNAVTDQLDRVVLYGSGPRYRGVVVALGVTWPEGKKSR